LTPPLYITSEFVNKLKVTPALLKLKTHLVSAPAAEIERQVSLSHLFLAQFVPVGRRPASRLLYGTSGGPVVFPVMRRLIIGFADDRAFDRLNQNRFRHGLPL
jgi:hypothetical protein